MENEHLAIEVEGEEANDLYPHLVWVEVEKEAGLSDMFAVQLALSCDHQGTWELLEDARLRPWKQITFRAGFDAADETLLSGYITHMAPVFDPDPAACVLEIRGMDASVLMDRNEVLKAWPDKKDSDIAREIFESYGFTADVEETEVVHREAISTIIQRETDLQFLKRLALRNGFECYVEEKTGCFKKPNLTAAPQPVLAVHFGNETSVHGFSLSVSALGPAHVAVAQVDRLGKEVLKTHISENDQPLLGRLDASDLRPAGISSATLCVDRKVATGQPEMDLFAKAIHHQAHWFVTGRGEVMGNHYGHVLKARQTVPIKGIGDTFSGLYTITRVTHTFTDEGYSQRFSAKRNALEPTGSETFSDSPFGL
ncbi:phage late control D family protein [Desulfoluna spongiiphila]|uniref:phage late control D family protein n=1 Tax=Desulfoluna spongiiphila TaxID=419481 RepID=UPI00125787FB|nr:contractile injection system protein, VgrG/Pvc8 family [Desulfoluna spongiiphila]VVS94490.1 phage late control gene d protein (gpd) [Desulfoluna spongiiphila]